MKSMGYRLCVLALAVLALLATIYSGRASAAHALFFRARYRPQPEDDADFLTRECEGAYALYRHNYHFSRICANAALERALATPEGEARDKLMRQARSWCDFGLEQNRYDRGLRLCRVGILEESDCNSALEYWKAHVDWQYWHPHNHSILAILAARCGELATAEASLELIRGTEYYAATEQAVREAQRRYRYYLLKPEWTF